MCEYPGIQEKGRAARQGVEAGGSGQIRGVGWGLGFAGFVCCSEKKCGQPPDQTFHKHVGEKKKAPVNKQRERGELCGTTASLNAGINSLR